VLAHARDGVKSAERAGVAGSWILVEQFSDEKRVQRIELGVAGSKLTGHGGPSKLDGTITHSVFTFKRMSADGQTIVATYTGRLENELLVGQGMLATD
jgi:hypothetical protein